MARNNAKKIIIIFLAVVVLGFGFFFLKKQNDLTTKAIIKNKLISDLKKDIEHSMSQFLPINAERLELQQKILTETKSLNTDLKKIILESKDIQLNQQVDFNLYEQKQNQIQNMVTKKIIEGLKSKDKKTVQYFQKNIKSLEQIEKNLNDTRMMYSRKIYELSKLENKKAVTFLSDTAFIEFEKLELEKSKKSIN